MKKTLNWVFPAIVSIFAAANTYAQSIIDNKTGLPLFSAFACSGQSSDDPDVRLSASITPAITAQSTVSVAIQEVTLSGSSVVAVDSVPLNANINSSRNGSLSSAVWNIKIGNSSIVTTFDVTPGTADSQTVAFNRKEASYRFKITHVDENNNFSLIDDYSPIFSIVEGAAPRIKITAAGTVPTGVDWNINETNFQVLAGCVSAPVLRIDPNNCSDDDFRLSISEYNFSTLSAVGPVVARALAPGERSLLKATGGLPINNFSDGAHTITFATGKHYAVYLTYTGQGQYKTTFGNMFFKAGTVDLMMRDDVDDNGFEPSDVFQHNIFFSPDILNKLSPYITPPSTFDNPTYVSVPGHSNKMMVTVTNIGCASSPPNTPLRMYWTRARAYELWSNHWRYNMMTNAFPDPNPPGTLRPAGSEITISGSTSAPTYTDTSNPYLLPAINAGSQFTIPFNTSGSTQGGVDWFPPYPYWYNTASGSMHGVGKPVICLLARINDPGSATDPIIYEPTGLIDTIERYVSNNNNIVTRNTWVTELSGFFISNPNGWNNGFGTVSVQNESSTPATMKLCVDLLPDISATGDFTSFGSIDIGTTQGLYNAWLLGGSQLTNATLTSPTLFTMTSGTHACLDNITLPAHSNEQIGLRFNYVTANLPTVPLQFNYVLRASSGTEQSPQYGSSNIYIVDVPTEAPNPPGEKPAGIDAVGNSNHIRVFPNPSEAYVDIDLNGKTGMITMYSMAGHCVRKLYVQEHDKLVHFDISDLTPGNYTVVFEDEDHIKSAVKFVKK